MPPPKGKGKTPVLSEQAERQPTVEPNDESTAVITVAGPPGSRRAYFNDYSS